MLRVALCDDETIILPYLSEQISSVFERFEIETEITSYSSSLELKRSLSEKNKYDIFFLDIDMKEMDGFKLASFIEERFEDSILIFISSKEEYVFSSFRHRPFSFIRKEKLKSDLEITIYDLQKKININKRPSTICLTDEQNRNYKFRTQDVIYIQAQDKYIYIKKTFGEQLIRSSLSAAEKSLQNTCFMRVHKSYLINLHMVYAIFYNKVVLDDGTTLPVGRSKVQLLKQRFCNETW